MGCAYTAGVQPGQRSMALGEIGSSDIIIKRKFRWTMCIEYCLDDVTGDRFVPEDFVKIGARPQVDIEEAEINYLHGKMWIPGKATWQTMTVTYYDVSGHTASGISSNSLFSWIASVYDFIVDPSNLYMGSKLTDYEGRAYLHLYDGCGVTLEQWVLNHVWPQSINFGELDMSSSEECTIELTLRYSEVGFTSFCSEDDIDPCPCSECEVS